MSKHTPGPWRKENSGDIFGPMGGDSGDGVLADCSDGWQVAEVGFYSSYVDDNLVELGGSVREANMRLIAAAPELLEALQDVVTLAESAMLDAGKAGHDYYIDAELDDARAAIAKAKGE